MFNITVEEATLWNYFTTLPCNFYSGIHCFAVQVPLNVLWGITSRVSPALTVPIKGTRGFMHLQSKTRTANQALSSSKSSAPAPFHRQRAGHKFCCSLSPPTPDDLAWFACWIVTIFSYCSAHPCWAVILIQRFWDLASGESKRRAPCWKLRVPQKQQSKDSS